MIAMIYINGKDAHSTWGCFLEDGSRDKLITGVPLKEFIENKSRLEHGKRVLYSSAKQDERDVELVFCFIKKGSFVSNYRSFMEEMYKGEVKLHYVDDEINETYHLTYQGCRNLNTVQYAGKVSIRFNEPNPANREND